MNTEKIQEIEYLIDCFPKYIDSSRFKMFKLSLRFLIRNKIVSIKFIFSFFIFEYEFKQNIPKNFLEYKDNILFLVYEANLDKSTELKLIKKLNEVRCEKTNLKNNDKQAIPFILILPIKVVLYSIYVGVKAL